MGEQLSQSGGFVHPAASSGDLILDVWARPNQYGCYQLAGGNALSPETAASNAPWMDTALTPDERAALLEAALTEDERHGLLHSYWATGFLPDAGLPEGAIPGAGYVPPISRLGVPGLYETDASLGVTNPRNARRGDTATALPSGLALAATFDADLAFEGGAMIGDEAARKGFNVLLGGGMNLTRDPRCGRNFEYLGEDPLLAGVLAGESIRGIQSQGIIATAKHFVLNDQETGRHVVNAVIDEAALRESDLLAFQIAIERGAPGAIMSAYNKINGYYACENDTLLNGVLKGDWAYPGFVMADWGATISVQAANAGLDQQSGAQLDFRVWFDKPLRASVAAGETPPERISDMARRILRSMFAAGLFDRALPSGEPVDYAAHGRIARRAASEGIVLLKNAGGLLPLSEGITRIVVIGGHSDVGVLCGGGSSQVTTGKGHAAFIHAGGEGAMMAMASEAYHPSPPLAAIKRAAIGTRVSFVNGRYPSEAAMIAREADVAIVFANQWTTEGADVPDLTLPNGQDALITATAAANPNTIVVLQTGGPVLMPWLDDVAGVLEAWYPGGEGGEAIADILFGRASPAGRLPVTFPQSTDQLPRPSLPGLGQRWQGPFGARVDLSKAPGFDIPHAEGSDVGYRWYARTGQTPLFPFGFGLSYTSFSYANLVVTGGETLRITFEVANTGPCEGIDTPQVYLTSRGGTSMLRLIGWSRLRLKPGERRTATITADPRLLADFDTARRGWRVPGGDYTVAVGRSAEDHVLSASASVSEIRIKP